MVGRVFTSSIGQIVIRPYTEICRASPLRIGAGFDFGQLFGIRDDGPFAFGAG
jgi:hypothetical protein